jgi:hypothetical protein
MEASALLAEEVAELLGPLCRGAHRRLEHGLHVGLIENADRALGGASLRSDLRAQQRGLRIALLDQANRARKCRQGEPPCVRGRESQLEGCLLQRFEKIEDVRGSAARYGGDSVEVVFALSP